MIVHPIKTSVFAVEEDLPMFLQRSIASLTEGSIICVASKIVALSQGRVRPKDGIDKDALVRSEAERMFPIVPGLALTYKDGHWCPNAGIDASNAFGYYILWPERPIEVAETLRRWLRETYQVKDVGVIITDSRIFPARHGVTAVALGYAGFRALKDYRGQQDLAGRPMEYTVVNVADALATAGSLVMGEGSECQPLALIEDAPVEFVSEPVAEELTIDPEKDLFQVLYDSKP